MRSRGRETLHDQERDFSAECDFGRTMPQCYLEPLDMGTFVDPFELYATSSQISRSDRVYTVRNRADQKPTQVPLDLVKYSFMVV